MLHELSDDVAGVPVRRCDRCGAILVSSDRCPSHDLATLDERIATLWHDGEPIWRLVLEQLQALREATPGDLRTRIPRPSTDVCKALQVLAHRGLAHRSRPGVWTLGPAPTGAAIVINSPAAARLATAQIRARRAA